MFCKKAALIGAGVVAGLLLVGGTRMGSYFGTAWDKVRVTTQKKVPIEFELDRIRHQVKQLVPDMEQHKSRLAEEMETVASLRREIDTARVEMKKRKDNILTMTADLESGVSKISYNGIERSADWVRGKLTRDLDAYKAAESSLKSKEKILEQKERAVETAREQLASINRQRDELAASIAELEAELQSVRLAETRSKFQIDDSRLSDIKQSIAEVRKQLNVRKIKVDLDKEFVPDVFSGEKKEPARDPVKEAHDLFGEKPSGKVVSNNQE